MSMNMLGDFFVGSTMVGGDPATTVAVDTGGSSHGETRVAGSMSLALGMGTAVSNGNTTVTAKLTTLRFLAGAITDHTNVAGSLYVDIPRGTAAGKTTVTGKISMSWHLTASSIGKTTVTSRLSVSGRLGNVTIPGFTNVTGKLSRAVSFSSATAHGSTTVSGSLLKLNFVTFSGGTAACSTTVKGSLRVGSYSPTSAHIDGYTALRSRTGKTYGPFGYVNLTLVPHGDLGTASIIFGFTTVTADVSVERPRTLAVFSNAGLSVSRRLMVTGSVVAGAGTRIVGGGDTLIPVLPREPVFV